MVGQIEARLADKGIEERDQGHNSEINSGSVADRLKHLMGVVHAAWGQILSMLLALAGIRIFTEILAKTEFGTAMLFMGALAFIDGISTLAFNQTLLSLCGRTKDFNVQRMLAAGLALKIVRAVIILALVSSILTAIISLAFRIEIIWSLACLFVGAYVASEALKTSMQAPMIVDRQYARYSLWSVSEAAFNVLMPTLFLLFIRSDAVGFAAGFVAGRLISTLVFFIGYFGGSYFSGLDLTAAIGVQKEAFRYGLHVSLMAPLGWASVYLDRYILSAFSGVASVGGYTAVMGLTGRPFALITSILTNYFQPLLYRHTAVGADMRKQRMRVQRLWAFSAIGFGVLSVIAALFLGKFVASIVLAPEYRIGARSFMIFACVAQMFVITTHSADNTILASGNSSLLLRVQLGLAVVTLIAIPAGIIWLGPIGAVIGRSIAEAIKCGVTQVLLRYTLRESQQSGNQDNLIVC